MPSLQKLLGKEDRFFDLLEASGAEARASLQALIKMVDAPGQPPALDEFINARRRNKAIAAEISEELLTNVVTALEREDIEALSATLYKIPKNLEKIAERMHLAPQHLAGVDVSRQTELLARAVEAVCAMLKDVRAGVPWAQVKEHNAQLQTIEGDADKVVLELLRDLYNGQQDAGRVIYLKDLFELYEKSIDRCRDAGVILTNIVLKSA